MFYFSENVQPILFNQYFVFVSLIFKFLRFVDIFYSNVIITLLIREGGRDHVQEREIEGSSVREGYIGIKCKRGR